MRIFKALTDIQKPKIIRVSLVLLLSAKLILMFLVYPPKEDVLEFGDISVFTYSSNFSNVYLVISEGRQIMIESGSSSDREEIESFIKSKGVSPSELSALIVTHAHHDHAGTAAYFQEHYGVPIVGGKGDEKYFKAGENGALCPTGLMAKLRHKVDQKGTFRSIEPNILVDDSLSLSELTGLPVLVTNLPGHTPGSLVVKIQNIVFVGDLFRGGIFNYSSAGTHLYQCDMPKVTLAIRKLLDEFAPNANMFFPSHLSPASRASVTKLLRASDQ